MAAADIRLLIGAGVLTLACADPTAPVADVTPGIDPVGAFLASQADLGPWKADTVVADPGIDATVFVAYSGRSPTLFYGLAHAGRIGWLMRPAGASMSSLFDVRPDDAPLFDSILQLVARTSAWRSYRVRLASDPDTPETALVSIAWTLPRDVWGPSIALTLLDNPRATRSLTVIQLIALLSRPTPAWQGTHEAAWDLVTEAQSGLGTWEPSGMFFAHGNDQIRGQVGFSNRDSMPLAIAYPDACFTDLVAYGAAGYGEPPVWDQGAARAAGAEPCEYTIRYDLVSPGWIFLRPTPPASSAEILGDSLPAGTYRFAIRFRFFEPVDTTFMVPVGQAELEAW